MRMADPFARAETAKGVLDRFGDVTVCAEFGPGWSCTQLATPVGSPRIIGRDDQGCEVWMRLWRCVAGHSYDLEKPSELRYA